MGSSQALQQIATEKKRKKEETEWKKKKEKEKRTVICCKAWRPHHFVASISDVEILVEYARNSNLFCQ